MRCRWASAVFTDSTHPGIARAESRAMVGEPLARAGVFAFAFVLTVPFVGGPAPRRTAPVSVASAFEPAGVQGIARGASRVRDGVIPEIVAGRENAPEPAPEPAASPIAPSPPARKLAPPPPIVLPSLEPQPVAGIVLASWYGPRFYGNRTPGGRPYTPQILAAAHRSISSATAATP